jgi:hypothetical protein
VTGKKIFFKYAVWDIKLQTDQILELYQENFVHIEIEQKKGLRLSRDIAAVEGKSVSIL